jgi:hypothetical protein
MAFLTIEVLQRSSAAERNGFGFVLRFEAMSFLR